MLFPFQHLVGAAFKTVCLFGWQAGGLCFSDYKQYYWLLDYLDEFPESIGPARQKDARRKRHSRFILTMLLTFVDIVCAFYN
jgi:hypothetical protein